MSVEIIVGCTGHRPDKLGGYSQAAFRCSVEIAATYLLEVEATVAITGMALGWDQAFCVAALEANIEVIAAVPFAGQESRWPDASKRFYLELIDRIDKRGGTIEIVSPGEYTKKKMQVRNEWVANRSHRIGACWNGTEGGTANCVRYVRDCTKVPIDNLYVRWHERMHGGSDGWWAATSG